MTAPVSLPDFLRTRYAEEAEALRSFMDKKACEALSHAEITMSTTVTQLAYDGPLSTCAPYEVDALNQKVRDIESKLRIVRHVEDILSERLPDEMVPRSFAKAARTDAEYVLRLLAAPFAGHVDYRKEWAVD